MRKLLIATLMAASFGAPAMAADTVVNSSFTEPNGDRVLQVSIVIDAPAAKIWKSFVDEPTLKAWNAPVARVDLRNGGAIEQGYDPQAKLGGPNTIHHSIITYLPERLLVLRNISTPPGLPGAELYRQIVQIVSLEPLGEDRTRVTLSHSGYGQGAGYDGLYRFFTQGNTGYLAALKTLNEKP